MNNLYRETTDIACVCVNCVLAWITPQLGKVTRIRPAVNYFSRLPAHLGRHFGELFKQAALSPLAVCRPHT